jgi:hypothetical protein
MENKETIDRVLAIIGRIAVGIAFIALAIATGGVALIGLKAAIAIVAISTLAGGAYVAINGGNVFDVIEGMSKGFMGGGIALFATCAIAAIGIKGGVAALAKTKVTSSGKSLAVLTKKGKFIASVAGGGIDGAYSAHFEGKCVAKGMGQGMLVSGLFAGIGNAISSGAEKIIGKIVPELLEPTFVGEALADGGNWRFDFIKDIGKSSFKNWAFSNSYSDYSSFSTPLFTPFSFQPPNLSIRSPVMSV